MHIASLDRGSGSLIFTSTAVATGVNDFSLRQRARRTIGEDMPSMRSWFNWMPYSG